jgi:tRNA threonylcarbamoyladenosine biosynthesis protein TsaE
MDTFVSHSDTETMEFGRRLGSALCGGEVILLCGPLGSGKTMLTKGIAAGIGIQEVVTSPSFAILCLYHGEPSLCHADFYRVQDTAEMEDLLEDYLYHVDFVTVVEWGEPLISSLPSFICIRVELAGDSRMISVEREDSEPSVPKRIEDGSRS